MSKPLESLIDILSLEPQGQDRWRGIGSTADGADGTYGGHLLGQATAAALASVDDERVLHSIHGYFLRAGQPQSDYEYEVTRVRDGRSFSSRRVTCMQHGKTVFELMASLAVPEDGPSFSPPPPQDFDALPSPESLPRYRDVMAAADPLPLPAEWALREHGIDLRPVNAPWCERGPCAAGGIRHWIRANGTAPDTPALHSAMLAYQSDESLADSLLIPFKLSWGAPGVTFVSLDHALWMHRQVQMNEWLFVEQWPGPVANARGVAHGRVWTQAGALVATFSQEALLRFSA
jgi:acyl-CoA thioesterase-2